MNSKFAEITIEFQDKINKVIDRDMREVYKVHKGNREDFINEVSRVILANEVDEEFLNLSKTSKSDIKNQLNKSIAKRLKKEGDYEHQFMTRTLTKSAEIKYSTNTYILNIGRATKLTKLTSKQLTSIVNKEMGGKKWSKRLWTNKRSMEKVLRKEIRDLIDGRTSINKVEGLIRNRFDQNAYNTRRLVNTELARVQDDVNDIFAEEHGIQKQMFMATLDDSTSSTCGELDGKEFAMDDSSKPDVPLHPNCRSVLVNIVDDWKPSVRKDNITKEYGSWTNYKDWENEQK